MNEGMLWFASRCGRDQVAVFFANLPYGHGAASAELIVLAGGMGRRKQAAAFGRLEEPSAKYRRIVLATGRFIGEGFDDPWLDTLFLAMPISWRRTLQQYAGRLHREHDAEREHACASSIGSMKSGPISKGLHTPAARR